jgi:hypothetical protein
VNQANEVYDIMMMMMMMMMAYMPVNLHHCELPDWMLPGVMFTPKICCGLPLLFLDPLMVKADVPIRAF